MRTITDTLKAAQQSGAKNVLVKLVLTHDSTTYTYTKILDIKETEDGPLQSCELVLNNSDKVLTDLDFRGFQGVLSYGVVTSAGEEYSALAPMRVLAQKFDSDPNKLECTLSLVGICNLMAQDEASAAYQPDDTDTKTVKTLVDSIIGATLACFNHCTAYQVEWDTGYDDLADTYKPKDAFRVYVGNNRLSAINRLLEYTKNVAVVKNDGKIHIFKPTTSGETYDSEYSLESGHTFFAKALRNRLVTPNYIKVQSREDDDPQYSGTAQDDSYAKLPKSHFKRTYLESNAQATAIAEAMLARAQMWCEAGAANVPLNVGAETFDYVKVTDERENDYRVGNIGRLVRHYDVRKNEWRMTFVFGNWQNVRKALDQLGITADDLENYFSRLSVADLYAEHIMAKNMDFVWIDPDNTIDLSKIGDNLDNLPNGEVYARVKTLHLDAGQIKLDENILYSSGYNPTTKFDLGSNDFDDIPEGTVYQRTKSAALSAAGLILLDQVIAGTYGLVYSADISAHHIKLSKCSGDLDDIDDGSTYGKLYQTDIDSHHIKLSSYVKVSGQWYSENGVIIDATSGIEIRGGKLTLANSAGQYASSLYIDSSGYLRLDPWSRIVADDIFPSVHNSYQLGKLDMMWKYLYVKEIISTNYSILNTYADLSGLQYMVLPKVSSAPSSVEGRMWFHTGDNEVQIWINGTKYRFVLSTT